MAQEERSMESISQRKNVEEEQPSRYTKEAQVAVLEDREKHLNWLLSLYNREKGIIKVDEEMRRVLEEEPRKIRLILEENKFL
jgi:hypothetical protein